MVGVVVAEFVLTAYPVAGYDYDVQCTHPVLIRVPGYVGPKMETGLFVPCGHCQACRIAHAREWATRLLHEYSTSDCAAFLTLTYSPDNVPAGGSIAKRELQLFFKRLRKTLSDRKIKYYACGEYGELYSRPHYHAIVFGLHMRRDKAAVESAWPYGFVKLGTVTYDSCRYVAQYVDKKYSGDKAREVYGDKEVPFQLQSKGLGRQYARENRVRLMREQTDTINGRKVGIPRYYRKLLWLDDDRVRSEAETREEALKNELIGKGAITVNDQVKFVYRSHAQREANLASKLALRARDFE